MMMKMMSRSAVWCLRLSCCSMAIFLCVRDVWGSEWSADTPVSITAVSGLCVHISCSYTYPGPRVPGNKLTGIWFQGKLDHQIYNSRSWELVDTQFWNRTRLLGSLDKNECSLKIGPLDSGDARRYTFRIEVDGRDRFSYMDHSVSLKVTDVPPAPFIRCPSALAEGVAVSLVCAVMHTCPEAPPVIRWSSVQAERLDRQPQGRRRLQQGWEERAVLNLLPSSRTNGELLRCSAEFPNGLQALGPECRLVVNYAPRNVTLSVRSPAGLISEGDTVVLSCQADSQPVAHLFSWLRRTEGRELPVPYQRGQELLLANISRDPGWFWCEVENSVGSLRSQPLTLDILYVPKIMKESRCSVTYEEEVELSCECVAYGNPIPSIQWIIPKSAELIPGRLNASQSRDHKTVAIFNASALWNHTATELTILCVAENSLASTTKAFTLIHNITDQIRPETTDVPSQSILWALWGPLMGLGVLVLLLFTIYYLFRFHITACLINVEPLWPETP